MTDAEAEIIDREDQRIAAVVASDRAVLSDILHDDCIYTHLNGQVDDKESYLSNLNTWAQPLSIDRREQRLHVHGDCAVLNSKQHLKLQMKSDGSLKEFDLVVTSNWTRVDGCWRVVGYHAHIPPAA